MKSLFYMNENPRIQYMIYEHCIYHRFLWQWNIIWKNIILPSVFSPPLYDKERNEENIEKIYRIENISV